MLIISRRLMSLKSMISLIPIVHKRISTIKLGKRWWRSKWSIQYILIYLLFISISLVLSRVTTILCSVTVKQEEGKHSLCAALRFGKNEDSSLDSSLTCSRKSNQLRTTNTRFMSLTLKFITKTPMICLRSNTQKSILKTGRKS